jgi:hypothetical protein
MYDFRHCVYGLGGKSYLLSPHVAFVTSSAEAIQSVIPIPIKAKALQMAEVSAFSNAAVLLINHSHHLA